MSKCHIVGNHVSRLKLKLCSYQWRPAKVQMSGAVLPEFSMFARMSRPRSHGARQLVLCKKLITQYFRAGDTSMHRIIHLTYWSLHILKWYSSRILFFKKFWIKSYIHIHVRFGVGITHVSSACSHDPAAQRSLNILQLDAVSTEPLLNIYKFNILLSCQPRVAVT